MKIFKILVFIVVVILIAYAVVFFLAKAGWVISMSKRVTPHITWQADPKIQLCYNADACPVKKGFGEGSIIVLKNSQVLGAYEYCNHLKQDGKTISNDDVNYWRLPNTAELTYLVASLMYDNTTVSYWAQSALESNKGMANQIESGNGDLGISQVGPQVAGSVRCVH